jgi:transcription termination factor NusB
MTGHKLAIQDYHRFIDEAGDMTFFGKGKVDILGSDGVSKCFMLGMVHIKQPLDKVREKIKKFTNEICVDPYFNEIPSIKKRLEKEGMYLHAKDDPPELRYKFFEVLKKDINFSLQIIVGRKEIYRFVNNHNAKDSKFYADLLSHLLKDKANYDKLVINIASRGSVTRINNLERALLTARNRYLKKKPDGDYKAKIVFNVQPYNREPLLAITDYGLWAVQRIFERGETRFYDSIKDKLPLIIDLYDTAKYKDYKNYYGPKNPLTKRNMI